MTTNQHQEILRTEGLSKFFPGVKALDNVDFSLRRGEIMALLGENGAGKSTLIKALTGVYHADRGTIWLEGQTISPKNTAHAQQLGIGTVYQEVNLLPNMSVADNLFIGREPKRFGLLRRKEMEKRATELMASYGFSLDVREPLNRFSVAMQQIVAICRAIDLSAKVLILDEPTASLDTQEVELLFGLMRQLRDRGVSLIDPQDVEFKCTCSRERCADALKTLPDEEVDSILTEDGEIDMHCDYCGNHYLFNAMDIAEIRNNASPADPQVH